MEIAAKARGSFQSGAKWEVKLPLLILVQNKRLNGINFLLPGSEIRR